MSNENTLFTYHLNLLKAFREYARQQAPFNALGDSDGTEELPNSAEVLSSSIEGLLSTDAECFAQLNRLCEATGNSEELNSAGQQLVSRIVAGYSHLTPHLHRDLFWFFGGDCLHYMPDEEIERYQQLDERRHEAEEQGTVFHLEDERAKIFGLH